MPQTYLGAPCPDCTGLRWCLKTGSCPSEPEAGRSWTGCESCSASQCSRTHLMAHWASGGKGEGCREGNKEVDGSRTAGGESWQGKESSGKRRGSIIKQKKKRVELRQGRDRERAIVSIATQPTAPNLLSHWLHAPAQFTCWGTSNIALWGKVTDQKGNATSFYLGTNLKRLLRSKAYLDLGTCSTPLPWR